MPTFEYTAIGEAGRKKNGVIIADNARAVRHQLRFRSLTPLKVSEVNESAVQGRRHRTLKLKRSELVLSTRQLAIMIESGVQIEQALGSISSQTKNAVTQTIFANLRDKVSEGYKLSTALADYPKSFSRLYISATAAGELSGDLSVVLANLADHQEKSQAALRKVQTAMIYPTVLGGVALLVIALLMVFVVPRVVDQFISFGQDLPLLTRIVIGISGFMQSFGLLVLIAIFGAMFAARRALRQPSVRRAMDGFILRTPVAGNLVRISQGAQFARTFAMLVGSGTPVLDSLAASRDSVGNTVFVDATDQAIIAVRDGSTPAHALTATGVFPTMLTSLIASGTASNNLADLMNKGANYLEDDFDRASALFLGLLEPAIILILGTLVALIVLSIMLPLMQLNQLAFS